MTEQIHRVYFHGHYIDYLYVSQYTAGDGSLYNVYAIDESTIPHEITDDVSGLEYIYVGKTGNDYLAFQWNHYDSGVTYFVNWANVNDLTKAALPADIVKVSTTSYDTGGVTFALSSDGRLFCAGSNEYGALGLGMETGNTTMGANTGNPVPNVYVNRFRQVQGEWIDVSVEHKGRLVFALKSDGSLWSAGSDLETDNATNTYAWGMTNSFVLRDRGPWENIGMGYLAYRSDGAGGYEIGAFPLGGGAIEITPMAAATWNALISSGLGKSCPPPELFAAYEGCYHKYYLAAPTMGPYSFIGGSFLDFWSKPAGTLWRVSSNVGTPVQISADQFSHVAGVGYSVADSSSDDLAEGACIAIKQR